MHHRSLEQLDQKPNFHLKEKEKMLKKLTMMTRCYKLQVNNHLNELKILKRKIQLYSDVKYIIKKCSLIQLN